jgi:hypothetical protein
LADPNAPIAHELLPNFAADGAYPGCRGTKRLEIAMTDKNTRAEGPSQRQMASAQPSDHSGLQQRYGTIGIEAVAAAVRYSNPGKKAAEPATAPRIDQRFFEQAS